MSWLTALYRDLEESQALWPFSPGAFRHRFACLCNSLGLPTTGTQGKLGFTPASLRAGGATALLEATEDIDLVPRRGRWQNFRTLEIYIQELQAASVLPGLSPPVRNRILRLAAAAPNLHALDLRWISAKAHPGLWPRLLREEAG